MKKLLTIISLALVANSYAQEITYSNGKIRDERSFEDCEGNIYSINDLLSEGKPLIVFTSTVDCGYCFEEAPEVAKQITATKDKINWLFALIPHNSYPRCSGQDAGDHDWPADWVSRYPGYANAKLTVQASADGYWLTNCEVTTAFGAINPITKKIIGSGCREGGRESAVNAALKLYTDGEIKRFANTVVKPTISVVTEGNTKKVSMSTTTANADIYYTLNGNTPTKDGIKYTGSFAVSSTILVKASAFKADMNVSPVSANFVKQENAGFINIAKTGKGLEWTGNTSKFSNSNLKPLAGVNDGKADDISLNGGKDDVPNAFQSFGVMWDKVQSGITALKLTNCTPEESGWGGKNYFTMNMTLQYTQDGSTWIDVPNFGHYPEYPYGRDQIHQFLAPVTYFTDKPITAKGIRVTGMVNVQTNDGGGCNNYSGLRELEIFQSDKPTALEDVATSNSVSLYPNPAKEALNVRFSDLTFTEYSLTDMVGRIVLTNKIKASTETIDVSNLEKGIYLFTAKGAKSYVQKVLLD